MMNLRDLEEELIDENITNRIEQLRNDYKEYKIELKIDYYKLLEIIVIKINSYKGHEETYKQFENFITIRANNISCLYFEKIKLSILEMIESMRSKLKNS